MESFHVSAAGSRARFVRQDVGYKPSNIPLMRKHKPIPKLENIKAGGMVAGREGAFGAPPFLKSQTMLMVKSPRDIAGKGFVEILPFELKPVLDGVGRKRLATEPSSFRLRASPAQG